MEDSERKKAPSSISPCGCVGSCGSLYDKPWVEELLGESFHPGGIELTCRTIASLELPQGAQVLDVASGTGVSARALAKSGYVVVGIDASSDQVERATERARGVESLTFQVGSAEALPTEEGSFDGLFCECALSLFSDKPLVVENWVRALRPGGRLAISDMVANSPLPESLAGVMGDWACLGGALSEADYRKLLLDAGFEEVVYVDEREAMLESISQLKRKLLVFGIAQLAEVMESMEVSMSDLRTALSDAKKAVESGALSYGRFTGTRSGDTSTPTNSARAEEAPTNAR